VIRFKKHRPPQTTKNDLLRIVLPLVVGAVEVVGDDEDGMMDESIRFTYPTLLLGWCAFVAALVF